MLEKFYNWENIHSHDLLWIWIEAVVSATRDQIWQAWILIWYMHSKQMKWIYVKWIS